MYSLSHYSCSHIPAANLCLYVNLVSGHQQVCLPPLPGHPPHRLGPADNHEIVPKDWIEKGKKSQQNGDQHFLKFCLGLLWTHAPHCHLCQPWISYQCDLWFWATRTWMWVVSGADSAADSVCGPVPALRRLSVNNSPRPVQLNSWRLQKRRRQRRDLSVNFLEQQCELLCKKS